MNVLVGCEFSGIVREAFRDKGHNAWSCDLLDSEIPGNHIKDDIRNYLHDYWDLFIAHPPCTYLCVSGARWFADREIEQELALKFVCELMNAPINKISIENPISVISSRICKPTQIIQPYHFGEPETKATCLWLKNLPKLYPTNIVSSILIKDRIHRLGPSRNRQKERSRTYKGIAKAMAEQWG